METNKKIIIDLDNTISITENGDYQNSIPNNKVVNSLKQFKSLGYEIVIYSSRNMRTYSGNIGKINVHTLPIILEFLNKHDIPFDEVIIGKPWCGYDGFYVDDKAIRPSEFVKYTEDEIQSLLKKETEFIRADEE